MLDWNLLVNCFPCVCVSIFGDGGDVTKNEGGMKLYDVNCIYLFFSEQKMKQMDSEI